MTPHNKVRGVHASDQHAAAGPSRVKAAPEPPKKGAGDAVQRINQAHPERAKTLRPHTNKARSSKRSKPERQAHVAVGVPAVAAQNRSKHNSRQPKLIKLPVSNHKPKDRSSRRSNRTEHSSTADKDDRNVRSNAQNVRSSSKNNASNDRNSSLKQSNKRAKSSQHSAASLNNSPASVPRHRTSSQSSRK